MRPYRCGRGQREFCLRMARCPWNGQNCGRRLAGVRETDMRARGKECRVPREILIGSQSRSTGRCHPLWGQFVHEGCKKRKESMRVLLRPLLIGSAGARKWRERVTRGDTCQACFRGLHPPATYRGWSTPFDCNVSNPSSSSGRKEYTVNCETCGLEV